MISLKMLRRDRSVDTILRPFKRVITDLEAHVDRKTDEVIAHAAEVARQKMLSEEAGAEATRAAQVARKLSEVFSA